MAGRPFRFLSAALGGWVVLRLLVLLPPQQEASAEPRFAAAAPPGAQVIAQPHATPPVPNHHAAIRSAAVARSGEPFVFMPVVEALVPRFPGPKPLGIIRAALVQPVAEFAGQARHQGALSPSLPANPAATGRWGGSAWVIARPSGPAGGLGSSQLGGSQAGARLTYALGTARRVALVGRVATPLEGRGREAALGVEWRPAGAPVRLFAEQRIALDDGARGGPSAGVIAGVDRRLAAGFRLEAYGQAGVIKRDRLEGFADGAARVARSMGKLGPAALDLGVGAWGGAQRGTGRLDLGPTLGMSIPVGERRLRLALDYRARVAGAARPGSGPVLSIGADF